MEMLTVNKVGQVIHKDRPLGRQLTILVIFGHFFLLLLLYDHVFNGIQYFWQVLLVSVSV